MPWPRVEWGGVTPPCIGAEGAYEARPEGGIRGLA